jgi:hypothetical protein
MFSCTVLNHRMCRVDLESDSFVTHLQPFLGNRAAHFVHELVSFAKSPFDIIAYDGKVQYNWPAHYPVPVWPGGVSRTEAVERSSGQAGETSEENSGQAGVRTTEGHSGVRTERGCGGSSGQAVDISGHGGDGMEGNSGQTMGPGTVDNILRAGGGGGGGGGRAQLHNQQVLHFQLKCGD